MCQPALPSNTAVTRESETACRSRSRKQGVCLYLGGISGSVTLRNSYHSISPKQRRGFLPQESTSCRASVAQTNSYCYARGSPSAIPFPSAGSQAGRWGAVDTGTVESTGPRDSVHCTHVLMLTGSMTTQHRSTSYGHISLHTLSNCTALGHGRLGVKLQRHSDNRDYCPWLSGNAEVMTISAIPCLAGSFLLVDLSEEDFSQAKHSTQ